MKISIKTVETHLTSVVRKVLSNRHELAGWASDRGIV
jgi:DNA-binding CsgD family transcriptional regulator